MRVLAAAFALALLLALGAPVAAYSAVLPATLPNARPGAVPPLAPKVHSSPSSGKSALLNPISPSLVSGNLDAPSPSPQAGKGAVMRKVSRASILAQAPARPGLTTIFPSSPSPDWYWARYDAGATDGGDSDWLVVANPTGNTLVGSVTVYEGGQVSSTNSFSIGANTTTSVSLPPGAGGPVVLQASGQILAVEKVKVNGITSYIPPISQPSLSIYFPECSPPLPEATAQCTVTVANPPGNSQASVTIQAGTAVIGPVSLTAGQLFSTTFSQALPVVVNSTQPVVADKYYQTQFLGTATAFTEAPGTTFTFTQAVLPAVDATLDGTGNGAFISVMAPPTDPGPASVSIEASGYSYLLPPIPPGQRARAYLPNMSIPSVLIASSEPVAAEAVEGSAGLVAESYPANPSASEVLPVFDSLDSPDQASGWLVVANPPTASQPVSVSVAIGTNSYSLGSVSPGSVASLGIPSAMTGPVMVSSSGPVVSSLRLLGGPAPPQVFSISPNFGALSGGTHVTITGASFYPPLAVFFGSSPATQVTINGAGQLVAVAPPSTSSQTVAVVVRNISGASSQSSYTAFTYTPGIESFGSGLYGYDYSWPQCPSSFPPAGASFYIVGADYGAPFTSNPCLSAELAQTGGSYNLYAVIFWNGSTAYPSYPLNCSSSSTPDQCYAYNYGYNAASYIFSATLQAGFSSPVWWLDIEGAAGSSNPLWSSDLLANRAAVQGAIDFFSHQPVPGESSKMTVVGVYSSPCEWPQIVGGTDTLSGCKGYQGYSPGVPEWVANWNSPSTPWIYCSSTWSFTGGPIVMVQYSDNVGGYDGDYTC